MKKGDGWFENFCSVEDFTELSIYNCGKRLRNLNHHYGPATTNYFLLVYVKEGSATLLSHKDKVQLIPGDLLVMFPNAEVHYVADKDVPWTISWVGVHGTLVQGFMDKMGISAISPVYNVKNRYAIENLFEKIYNLSYSRGYSDKIAVTGLLYEFFSVLLSETKNIPTKDYPSEVMNIIRKNFDKDISVDEIATRLSINKSYLARIFKEKYNTSIKDFLINIRIKRAKELLADENATILKVSNSIGYTDPLYFSRIFKKKTGISPSLYRKNLKKADIVS